MSKQQTAKDSNATQQRNTKIGLILLCIVLITSFIVYLTFGTTGQPTAFFARSINDAAYDCEDKIDARFDEKLVSKYYDQYSSRYEEDKHQYVIYYRVNVQEEDDQDRPYINDYMAKCIVWERLGFVSDFQVFDKF